ncbi:MAG: hypothetical protein AB7P34_14235 [Vicinamibacterales bacterium]
MVEDLAMLANQAGADAEAATAKAEADKAAASETMPLPKHKRRRGGRAAESKAARVARRGQPPPAPQGAGPEDS